MTISTNKLNRITLFPIFRPSVLVAFWPFFFMPVYVMYIQCDKVIKATYSAFIAKICKQFRFEISIILGFFRRMTDFTFPISFTDTFWRAIFMGVICIYLPTDRAMGLSPTGDQVAFLRTIFAPPSVIYVKRVFAMLAYRIHIYRLLHYIGFVKHNNNSFEEYCQIARDRLRAVDTGVPVKEARAGQGALFE